VRSPIDKRKEHKRVVLRRRNKKRAFRALGRGREKSFQKEVKEKGDLPFFWGGVLEKGRRRKKELLSPIKGEGNLHEFRSGRSPFGEEANPPKDNVKMPGEKKVAFSRREVKNLGIVSGGERGKRGKNSIFITASGRGRIFKGSTGKPSPRKKTLREEKEGSPPSPPKGVDRDEGGKAKELGRGGRGLASKRTERWLIEENLRRSQGTTNLIEGGEVDPAGDDITKIDIPSLRGKEGR